MDYEELPREERRRLWGRLLIRAALIAAVLVFVFFIFIPLFSYLFPFVAALILSWVLHPLIRAIRKRVNIPRALLSFIFVMLIVLVAGGLIALFAYSIINEIISFINNWLSGEGALFENIFSGNLISDLLELLPESARSTVENALSSIMEWIQSSLTSLLTAITSKAGDFISRVPSFFIGLVVFISASYFITADYPNIRYAVTRNFRGGFRKYAGFVKEAMTSAFGAYLRAQLLLSLVVFFILLFGFLIIEQSYALLIAFVFAILDFIPLIGSGTVMVPWAVIALVTGDYVHALQLMVIWGVIAMFRRVFEPKIVGSQTGLSPLLSLMSIYVGMRASGVLGMILGPILLQVFLEICKSGFFNGLMEDVRLFVRDCTAILGGGPEKREKTGGSGEDG